LNAQAIKAYQAKDYAGFLAYEKQALGLDPDNPRIIYNVACGEALQGNVHEAVQLLDRLLARKLDLGAETDTDFVSIRKTQEWADFESRLAQLRKPLVHSNVAFKLTDPAIVATGIAVDPRTGDTYIASVRQRKILRRTRQGAVSDFISQGQDGFLAGASLAIDAPRHLLFATTAAAPFMLGYSKEDLGRSGIFGFDLKSGKAVRKVMLPADGKRHFLNALAIDHHGSVYVSDTGASGIYLLRPGASELEVFIPSSVFRATQGLAFSGDEKTLYVADYSDGLWAVDIASRTTHHLEAPAGEWLVGLDGLSRVQGGFITVQIGVKPERVLRLRLDEKGQRVAAVEVLEMSHPDYEGPIQGVVAGKEFLYVANSQLDLGNGESGAFASDRARPTIILRLPL
jgi:sugar lactone lactonase YvrE